MLTIVKNSETNGTEEISLVTPTPDDLFLTEPMTDSHQGTHQWYHWCDKHTTHRPPTCVSWWYWRLSRVVYYRPSAGVVMVNVFNIRDEIANSTILRQYLIHRQLETSLNQGFIRRRNSVSQWNSTWSVKFITTFSASRHLILNSRPPLEVLEKLICNLVPDFDRKRNHFLFMNMSRVVDHE